MVIKSVLNTMPACPIKYIAIVATEAIIGEVTDEKRMEMRMRIMTSKILKNTERRIGRMYCVPLVNNNIRISTEVEITVTRIVVAVNPRHLPTRIDPRCIGFGRMR